MKYKDIKPKLHPSVKNLQGQIIGDCLIEKDCNIWFNASIRGDMAPVHIKEGTNVQDNAVIHTNTGLPTHIGKHVTIGHSAIVHACTVGDYALVGMGAIILDGAEIGDYAMVAAGCLVPPGKKVPERTLVLGNPMKIIRELTDDEIKANIENARHYVALANQYQ